MDLRETPQGDHRAPATTDAVDQVDIILEALARLRGHLEEPSGILASIAAESRLHPVSARVALLGWIESITRTGLTDLLASARLPASGARVITLAPGNMPIVAVECLINGLLAGAQHTLALSSRASRLAMALAEEIRSIDERLSDRFDLVVWRACPADRQQEILLASRAAVVYGTRHTIDWIADRLAPGCKLLSHGPSLAVSLIYPAQLDPRRRHDALRGLARDVALYDQRGCRSPHVLFICGTRRVVDEIKEELTLVHMPAMDEEIPRGSLYPEEETALYLDRLTSRSLGEVVAKDRFTLTVEPEALVARPSPLGRTLRLIGFDDDLKLLSLIRSLALPVRLVGLAGPRPTILESLSPPPELASPGQLQTPPYTRLHDGRHRLDEYRPQP